MFWLGLKKLKIVIFKFDNVLHIFILYTILNLLSWCPLLCSICYENKVKRYLGSNTITLFCFLLFAFISRIWILFNFHFSHVCSFKDIAALMGILCFCPYVSEACIKTIFLLSNAFWNILYKYCIFCTGIDLTEKSLFSVHITCVFNTLRVFSIFFEQFWGENLWDCRR